nr:hypothetical protein [Micromonospora sp. DSM 115978]
MSQRTFDQHVVRQWKAVYGEYPAGMLVPELAVPAPAASAADVRLVVVCLDDAVRRCLWANAVTDLIGVQVVASLDGVAVTDEAGHRELDPELDPAAATDAFRQFVDDGQWAHYLLGDADTSPDRPHNATVKLGIVRPRSAFTPHAHGGEHLVLCLGYASCSLYDAATETVVDVALTPGTMIRIPSLLPHAFGNRAT